MQCVILVSICGQLNNLSMRHVTYSALPCVLTLVSKQPPALGGLCKSPRLQMAFMGLPRGVGIILVVIVTHDIHHRVHINNLCVCSYGAWYCGQILKTLCSAYCMRHTYCFTLP